MQVHELKTKDLFFRDVFSGRKTFEVRKNDRGFMPGDVLVLHEYKDADIYTGRSICVFVLYILDGGQYGIDKDYCVMGIGNKRVY